MLCLPKNVRLLVASAALALGGVVGLAQGPGGAPGMPMQRLGPSRGQATGMGAPGAPMARMGRTGGGFSTAAPARRNYGISGVMSSENFRASNLAGQARGSNIQRSSAGLIGGVTQGRATVPSNSR